MNEGDLCRYVIKLEEVAHNAIYTLGSIISMFQISSNREVIREHPVGTELLRYMDKYKVDYQALHQLYKEIYNGEPEPTAGSGCPQSGPSKLAR